MEPSTNNASGKIITALIIGLLIGFASGVFWKERRQINSASSQAKVEEMASEEEVLKTGELNGVVNTLETDISVSVEGVSVSDQPAGSKVMVSSVKASEPVWVAIREEHNGGLGNILGAQKVFIENQKDITVELLRPTKTGSKYAAVLYREVGSPAFNYREDVLISGTEKAFTATE